MPDSSYPGTRRPVPSGAGVFLPLLLLTLAFVAWLGFQAIQQVTERRQLAPLLATLEQQEQASIKLRSSLDAVATATAKLAADGNANAKTIVDELRKRGVTINPNAVKAP